MCLAAETFQSQLAGDRQQTQRVISKAGPEAREEQQSYIISAENDYEIFYCK